MKTITFYLPYFPLVLFVGICLFLLVKSFLTVVKSVFIGLNFRRVFNTALKVYFVITVIYILIVSFI